MADITALTKILKTDVFEPKIQQDDVISQNYVDIYPVSATDTYVPNGTTGVNTIQFELPNSDVWDLSDHRLEFRLKITKGDADTATSHDLSSLSRAGVYALFDRIRASFRGGASDIENIDNASRFGAIEVLSRSKSYNNQIAKFSELCEIDGYLTNNVDRTLADGAVTASTKIRPRLFTSGLTGANDSGDTEYDVSMSLPLGLFTQEKVFPAQQFPPIRLELRTVAKEQALVFATTGTADNGTSPADLDTMSWSILNPRLRLSKLTMTQKWYDETRTKIIDLGGIKLSIPTFSHHHHNINNSSGKQRFRMGSFKNLRRVHLFIQNNAETVAFDRPMKFVNPNLQAIKLLVDGNSYPQSGQFDTTIKNHSSMLVETFKTLGVYKDYSNDISFSYVRLNNTRSDIISADQWLMSFNLQDFEIDSSVTDGRVNELIVELDFSTAPGATTYELHAFVEHEVTFGADPSSGATFAYMS